MIILSVIVFLVVSPISVYFSVKFGRYGYLRATELFAQQQQNKVPYE